MANNLKKCLRNLLCLWVTSVFVFLVLNFPDKFTRKQNVQRILHVPVWNKTSFHLKMDGAKGPRHVNIPRSFSWNSTEKYFKLRVEKVNPLDANFLIPNRDFCADADPYLLAVVPSIPTHSHIRSIIRKTYGSVRTVDGTSKSCKVLFFFGRGVNKAVDKMILEESKTYRDIVQADFKESYANLTLKMMVILKWVATYCGSLDFMLKIDEDVFVNIPRLINALQRQRYEIKGSVYGHLHFDSSVRRRGKWAVQREQFPMPTYPPYASGNSYVISGNIIPRMFMAAEYMPYVPIEDVFISGILAKIVGAKHVAINGFTAWLDKAPDPCRFVKDERITATKVDAGLMLELWNACTSYEETCGRENKTTSNEQ